MVTFTNPVEALSVFKSKPEMFDLIFSDMLMPGMSGDKLIKEIKKIRPHIPVVISTGFSDTIGPDTIHDIGVTEFISKPFLFNLFSSTLEKALTKNLHPAETD